MRNFVLLSFVKMTILKNSLKIRKRFYMVYLALLVFLCWRMREGWQGKSQTIENRRIPPKINTKITKIIKKIRGKRNIYQAMPGWHDRQIRYKARITRADQTIVTRIGKSLAAHGTGLIIVNTKTMAAKTTYIITGIHHPEHFTRTSFVDTARESVSIL